MKFTLAPTTIHLHHHSVDMRKSIDGLVALISTEFDVKLLASDMFVFFNRRRDKIKILTWHHNGFLLCYKRLETKRIKTKGLNSDLQLSEQQLLQLLNGHEFLPDKPFDFTNFSAY